MNLKILDYTGYEKEIKELFCEYTDMLVENESGFKEYLSIQSFDEEIKNLSVKYGRPLGRLYILLCDNTPAGCVALKKLGEDSCELKRLYIRKKFRGNRFGKLLCEKIINDAKEIGYKYMYLDTLAFLKTAIGLYKELGFSEIPPYNDNPVKNSVFMKLDL